MTFRVDWSLEAEGGLLRTYDYLLEREIQREGNLALARRALEAICNAVRSLESAPFLFRKIGESPFLRELVVPFGTRGYVLAYEILAEDWVVIAAMRHQREDDYY